LEIIVGIDLILSIVFILDSHPTRY